MNKSFWNRMGLIFAGFYIIIELLTLVSRYTLEKDPSASWGITSLVIWSYFPFGFLYETFADLVGLPSYTPLPGFVIVIINIIIFYFVGVFINWIYRKIKKS